MSYDNKYHNMSTRYGLRQAIIITLFVNELTINDILSRVKKLPLTFELNRIKITRIIQKLANLGLIEYVYNDLNYSLRLTDLGYDEYNNITKTN